MRRLLGIVVSSCLALALLTPVFLDHALAASQAAGAGDGRPWGRLVVFVPLAVAIGAGTIALARYLRSRGIVRE